MSILKVNKIQDTSGDDALTFDSSGNTTVNQTLTTTNANITTGGTNNLTISDGDLVIGTSGHGINFAATSDASGSSSELFDDYEEGTFTPDWNNGLSSIGYTSQDGSYTKIGNRVFFSLYLLTASGTTGSNHLKIGGLPYTPDTSHPQAGAYVCYSQDMFDGKEIDLYITGGVINFYERNGSVLYSSEATPVGHNLIVQGFYRV